MSANDQIAMSFLNDEYCRIFMVIGSKGSGKTNFMLNYVKYHLNKNTYAEYHLIIPQMKNEADEQYSFLLKEKSVTIYNKYSPAITYKLSSKEHKKRILYCIDDATSQSNDFAYDEQFLNLMTTSRHLNICLMVIVHGCKKILTPVIRANTDRLVIFKCTTESLIKAIYDEFFSMNKKAFSGYKNFVEFYQQYILEVQYAGLYLDVLTEKR